MGANLKLDQSLIRQALRLGNFKSKREAVNAALTEFIYKRKQLRILELEGKIDFDPDWNYKKMRGGNV